MRLEPSTPFTTEEKLVIALIGQERTYEQISLRLHLDRYTVNSLALQAAKKLPGTLKTKTRLLFWSRGATKDQLTGEGWIPTHQK